MGTRAPSDDITLLKGVGFSMSNKQFVPVLVLDPGTKGWTVCWVNADWSGRGHALSKTGGTHSWTPGTGKLS